MTEPQRFPDRHGWLRNRRAVTVDQDGLCIERWLGRPVRVPWQQIIEAHWDGAELLTVRWLRGTAQFDRGVVGLGQLGDAIAAGMAPAPDRWQHVAVTRADVEGALAGYHYRVAELSTSKTLADVDPSSVGPLTNAAVLVGGPALMWAMAANATRFRGMEDHLAFALLLLPVIIALLVVYVVVDRIMRASTRRSAGHCAVTADADGVRASFAQGDQVFTWDEVRSVTRQGGQRVVHLRDQTFVAIPDDKRFERVFQALELVAEAQRASLELDRPTPETALSLAEHGAAADVDRGLSRAWGHDAQEAVDA